mmetsp:Transcript_50966/g.153229  ORF Transcript_50966/g.153229 Transcript_50966/m.153229 type:complete len:212 (+) Transcript_50966:599-1234(+)
MYSCTSHVNTWCQHTSPLGLPSWLLGVVLSSERSTSIVSFDFSVRGVEVLLTAFTFRFFWAVVFFPAATALDLFLVCCFLGSPALPLGKIRRREVVLFVSDPQFSDDNCFGEPSPTSPFGAVEIDESSDDCDVPSERDIDDSSRPKIVRLSSICSSRKAWLVLRTAHFSSISYQRPDFPSCSRKRPGGSWRAIVATILFEISCLCFFWHTE